MSFFPEIEITPEHGKGIARGMLTVAKVDGAVDVRELSLIQEFYEGGVETLEPIEPGELASVFGQSEAGPLFLKSCLLVALADRFFSDKERTLLANYAKALGVSEDELRALEQSVKEFLLQPLSRLANTEAVAKVASEMKVNE